MRFYFKNPRIRKKINSTFFIYIYFMAFGLRISHMFVLTIWIKCHKKLSLWKITQKKHLYWQFLGLIYLHNFVEYTTPLDYLKKLIHKFLYLQKFHIKNN